MTSAPAPSPAGPTPTPTLDALDPRDRAVVSPLTDLVDLFVNDSRWWQNASFALPALGFLLATTAGWLLDSSEAIGFGLFLGAVTAIMVPVVLLTWRGTATAIVLRRGGALSLHHGRTLEQFDWPALRRIERVEYLGNVRHKLVHGDEDRFMTVESEIDGAGRLVDTAFRISGLPRQQPAATP